MKLSPLSLSRLGCVLGILMSLPLSTVCSEVSITTDFPGGNAIVESIAGDTVRLAPDNRDSKPWFYWYFGVKGAAGRTLNFVFKPNHIGVHGPAISTDGGVTWRWMGAEAVKEGTFSHTFSGDAEEVRFSVGMPYGNSHFQTFLAPWRDNAFVREKTLTQSRKDRPVPLLLLGDPGRKAPLAVAVTARQHSCEMMGSYVLEGIIQGVMADDEQGRWLRKNVDFFLVPFADYDGVQDGDQGKNRAPHDHNRDYGNETIYPEVAAIKEQLPAWADGRPLVFFDIHNPALKGDVHELIQFLGGEKPEQSERLDRFAAFLDRDQQGLLIFRKGMIMKFGSGYNTLKEDPPPHAAGWARTLPNCYLGATLELPYANSARYEVNADSAREFGRDMAWALKAFLEDSFKEAQ